MTAGIVAVLLAACTPPPPFTADTDPDDVPLASVPEYATPGIYTPAVTTISLGDRDVEVWYPSDVAADGLEPDGYRIRDWVAEPLAALLPDDVDPLFVTNSYRDLPVSAQGPFPTILFSHGFLSFRSASSFLTEHLASWGFVVAAPDFIERGLPALLGPPVAAPKSDVEVLDATLGALDAAGDDPTSVLHGAIDTSEVLPMGHSAGGFASVQFANRPDIHSFITLGAGHYLPMLNPVPSDPDIPTTAMWIGGRNDITVGTAALYEAHTWTPGPSKLVMLDGTGHNNAFTDLCDIGDGGAVGLAIEAGIALPDWLIRIGNDGCLPPNSPPAAVQPIVAHLVIAEARQRLGHDILPVGLGSGITGAFGTETFEYQHTP